MITVEHKETMQTNCEATIKCLQNKGSPYILKDNGNHIEGVDGVYAHSVGDIVEPHGSLSGDPLESSNTPQKKTTHQNDPSSWLAFYPDASNVRLNQSNTFGSQFHPLTVVNHFQHMPFNMFPQNSPYECQFQDFHYFVVIDFEATCDKEKNPHPQEIIEFPSVIVSSMTGGLEGCFQTYVRPTCNRLLTDFCKDLTGIQQFQVDTGITLSEAILRHDKWLESRGIKNSNFAVVTWSNWDCRVMLESECRYKKIHKPTYFNQWINLRVPFCQVFGDVRCNLKEAVEMAGLSWQGRAHCGLDDAKNTARLLLLLMHKGFKFSITNSMMCQSADHLVKLHQQHPPFLPYNPQKLKDHNVSSILFHPCCYCGVRSSKGMVCKPGPKQGSIFFGCGNWSAARGARCHYFKWACP